MIDAMLVFTIVIVAWVGLALFALSQQRHWQAVAGTLALSGRRKRWQRAAAWILLTSSLIVTLRAEGASVGALLWPLLAGAAAFAISVTLAWRASWLAWLVPRGGAHKPSGR